MTLCRPSLKQYIKARSSSADDKVNREMIEVPARVLPPPKVNYGQGRSINPDSGSWNIRGNQVNPRLL